MSIGLGKVCDIDREVQIELSSSKAGSFNESNTDNLYHRKWKEVEASEISSPVQIQVHGLFTARILKCFLSFLYFVGMSPIKPDCVEHWPKCVLWFQKVIFWTVFIMSILQGLYELKYSWIGFLLDESLLNFLFAGFCAMDIFTRIYYTKLLATCAQPISQLIKKMDKFSQPAENGTTENKALWLAIAIGTSSIFVAGASTVFGDTDLHSWTWREAKLDRSVEISETLFIWSSENYTSALFPAIKEVYGTNLTMLTEMLAMAGNTLTFWGTLHANLLIDLWLIASIQIYSLQLQFSRAMADAKSSSNSTGRCPLSILWQQYKQLRAISEHGNDLFDNLFKMVHLQNSLLFGHYLFIMMRKGSASNTELLIDIFAVLKIASTYLILQRSSCLNESYVECVVRCSDCGVTCEMDGKLMSVSVLYNDMKVNAIGVGRGYFYVSEAFILQFAATVGSMFLFLADKDKDDDDKCNCVCSAAN